MKLAKRLLKMARPYWGVMAAAVVGLIGAAMMGLVTPEVVRRLTRSLKDPATMTVQVIGVYAAVLAGAYLLRAVFRFMSLYLAHVAAWKFVSDMTMRVYDKLQTLSMRYFGQQQTGEIMSRASNDTRMLELLIAHAVPDLISNIIIIIGVAVMLLIINPPMALLTLIPVPFVLLASWYFSGKIWPLFRRNQKITGELGGRLQDNLSGIKEIQAFGKEEHEHHKLADFCKYYSHANIRANFANAISLYRIFDLAGQSDRGNGRRLARDERAYAGGRCGRLFYVFEPVLSAADCVRPLGGGYSIVVGGRRAHHGNFGYGPRDPGSRRRAGADCGAGQGHL